MASRHRTEAHREGECVHSLGLEGIRTSVEQKLEKLSVRLDGRLLPLVYRFLVLDVMQVCRHKDPHESRTTTHVGGLCVEEETFTAGRAAPHKTHDLQSQREGWFTDFSNGTDFSDSSHICRRLGRLPHSVENGHHQQRLACAASHYSAVQYLACEIREASSSYSHKMFDPFALLIQIPPSGLIPSPPLNR